MEKAVDALLETALLAPTMLVPTNDPVATDLKLRVKRKINYSSMKVSTYSLACVYACMFTRSLTYSLTHLFINLFIRARLFVYLSIHLRAPILTYYFYLECISGWKNGCDNKQT